MTGASIEVRDLSYRYPSAEFLALSEVTMHVRPGERIGLLGPNGAGKTTLMRLLCGFLPLPSPRGRPPIVLVDGLSVREASRAVRQRVGYLPEQVPLYLELRVREHLAFRASIKEIPRRQLARELGRVAELTGLRPMLEVPIAKLSRGYRQRVGIADALLGAPPLVVLDEPTVGLDPNQVQAIRAVLRGLGGAQTLVFSSHILAEVEALCDRVVILSRGRVVADETVAEAIDSKLVVVEVADRAALDRLLAATRRQLDDPSLAPSTVAGDGPVRAELPGGAAVARAVGLGALEAGVALLRLEPGRRRLEERFARVTGALEEVA